MADDLGEEWWLNQGRQETDNVVVKSEGHLKAWTRQEVNTEQDARTEQYQVQSQIKLEIKGEDAFEDGTELSEGATHGQKRTHLDTDPTEASEEIPKKRKKKKKKKNLTEHLAASGDNPGTPDNLQIAMAAYFHKKLSAVEMEDLILDADRFIADNKGNETITQYLSRRIPEWGDWMKLEKVNATPNKSCLILLISPSAKRAVDVNRQAKEFKGEDCHTVKLFAKHFNINDQTKFLAKRRCQFAIGTPHRVTCLLESGALTLEATKYVILDWNRRDVKLLRMADMPELKRDLFELLRKHLMPAASKIGFKFGLF